MKRVPPTPQVPRDRQSSAAGASRAPLLGIAWRLGLGLAAVAAVLVAGEVLATRTTRDAAGGRSCACRTSMNRSRTVPMPCWKSWSPTIRQWALTCRPAVRTDIDGITLAPGMPWKTRSLPTSASGPNSPSRQRRSRCAAQLTRHIQTARAAGQPRRAALAVGGCARRGAQSRLPAHRLRRRLRRRHRRHAGVRAPLARRARSPPSTRYAATWTRPRSSRGANRTSSRSWTLNAAELQVSPGRAWLALVRQDFAERVRLRT